MKLLYGLLLGKCFLPVSKCPAIPYSLIKLKLDIIIIQSQKMVYARMFLRVCD